MIYAVCRELGTRTELAGWELRVRRWMAGWPKEVLYLPERFNLGTVNRNHFRYLAIVDSDVVVWEYKVELIVGVEFDIDGIKFRCLKCGRKLTEEVDAEWCAKKCDWFVRSNAVDISTWGEKQLLVTKANFILEQFHNISISHDFHCHRNKRWFEKNEKDAKKFDFKFFHQSAGFPSVGRVLFCTSVLRDDIEKVMSLEGDIGDNDDAARRDWRCGMK